jgi:hypothetical protein
MNNQAERLGRLLLKKFVHGLPFALFFTATSLSTTSVGQVSHKSERNQQRPYSAMERSAASDIIVQRIVDEFTGQKDSHGATYASKPDPKAAAICHQWPKSAADAFFGGIDAWGDAWDFDNQEQADQAALQQCQKRADEAQAKIGVTEAGLPPLCSCELLMRGNTVVISPPSAVVELTMDRLADNHIEEACSDWFAHSKKGNVSVSSGVAPQRSHCDVAPPGSKNLHFTWGEIPEGVKFQSPGIFPAAPVVGEYRLEDKHIVDPESGLPEINSIDFYPPLYFKWEKGSARWTYDFHTYRVPRKWEGELATQLQTLDRSRMYHLMDMRDDRDPPIYLTKDDKLAAYIRSYDLTDPENYSALVGDGFPDRTLSLLKGEKSVRLWVECFIPVDRNWVPVGPPMRSVIPLGLQTTKGFYIYAYSLSRNDSAGGSINTYRGKIFDISQCVDRYRCYDAVSDMFRGLLQTEFESPPIAATMQRGPPTPIRFERRFQPSLILAGFAGPFYELTTYSLVMWPAPSDRAVSPAADYLHHKQYSFSPPIDAIFLNMQMDLQIGIGAKSDYPEPTQQQYSAYMVELQAAVDRAIEKATQKLGGVMKDGVGVVPSLDQEKQH